jgi:tripartite-type tricarboxylate transporter receptor subunit TctC
MNNFNVRRRTVLAAACAAAVAPLGAQAPAYPNKPIRLVIPIQPGGIVDTTLRVIAERMANFLGQPVLADNRPGGNYVIGVNAAATAPPDGYTIFGFHQGLVVTQTESPRVS